MAFEQEGVWLTTRMSPVANASYNILFGFSIGRSFDRTAFTTAVDHMLQRHDALRLRVHEVDGMPRQFVSRLRARRVINEERQSRLSVVDVGKIERQRPFDLSKESPIRIRLFSPDDSQVGMTFAFHHLAFDAWSSRIFFSELSEFYRAYVARRVPTAQPLTTTYLAYARHQKKHASEYQCHASFWEAILRGIPKTISLPFRSDVDITDHAAGTFGLWLSPSTASRLKKVSAANRVTPFLFFLAALQVLIFRYTSDREFGIRIPVATRNDSDLESLIGMFVNMIVLPAKVDPSERFTELLKGTATTYVSSLDHQSAPFSEVIRRLDVCRNNSREPLSGLAFNYVHDGEVPLNLLGAVVNKVSVPVLTAKDDLMLEVTELNGRFRLSFVYRKGLFQRSAIEQMGRHYRRLLQLLMENPQTRVSEIRMLSENELRKMLFDWNATESSYPAKKCIHEIFEDYADKNPDVVAVRYERAQLTYSQLNRRANQIAHFLQKVGAAPDVRVGFCFERSLDMVASLLAILKAGAAYVPLDPSYPVERLGHLIADADIPFILAQEGPLRGLPSTHSTVICLDREKDVIESCSTANLARISTPDHLAYSMYTSGSTGRPKGIDVTVRGIVKLVKNVDYVHISKTDVFLQAAPLSFDASTFEIWGALLNGASLVIMPKGPYDTDEIAEVVHSSGITILWLTAALFEQITRHNIACLQHVRQLLTGGDVIPVSAARKFLTTFPSNRLINGYGPTECTTFACCYQIPHNIRSSTIPIGRPISNTQAYILDENADPVPIGVTGEIYIGGAGLARGYLNGPERTAAQFVPNPFSGNSRGARLYKTGDLGRYLEDGRIEFLGRRDRQVKIRGFRIELGEVECALRQIFKLGDVTVTLREDVAGDKRLVAYLACGDCIAPSSDELRKLLKSRLPEYLVPNAFVFLDALPLNANGKIDRDALPNPNADLANPISFNTRSSLDEILRNIWTNVLKISEIGMDDDFFGRGGHSLLAIQILSRIHKIIGVKIALREFFAAPTIRALASAIINAKVARSQHLPSIKKRAVISPTRISFAQSRLWFLEQYHPDSPLYNVPIALRIRGKLSLEIVQRALISIVERHEALRTVFKQHNASPAQYILRDGNVNCDVHNMSKNEDWTEQALREIAQHEIIRPFDLENGPLIRATIFVLGDDDHFLLLNLHHIVSDAWSVDVLLRELFIFYEAFQRGTSPALPPLRIQYGDFAVWQTEMATDESMVSAMSYWKKTLEGANSRLELPLDYPRPLVRLYNGSIIRFNLPRRLVQQFREFTKRTGTTSFITLIAAFNILIWRYTHQDDICIGYPAACRNVPDVEGLIGFFVNTLVLRTTIDPRCSFLEILANVRDRVLDADLYGDVPFEKLVEELNPERDLSRSPLFEVMFAYYKAIVAPRVSGLSVTAIEVESPVSKFDLTLTFRESADDLVGTFEYNTSLFRTSTIERMARHFCTLLESIIANPSVEVSALALLSNVEREQMLSQWNETRSYQSETRCIQELFELQAIQTPNEVAVKFEDKQLTYQELNEKANQLARYLQKVGLGPEDFVALCIDRSLEVVVALLGVLKAGGAYVPLDSTAPRLRLRQMLNDSKAKLLLTDRDIGLTTNKALTIVRFDAEWKKISRFGASNPTSKVASQNLAYCIYTSGSSGIPKGVIVSHSNLAASIRARAEVYPSIEKLLLIAPIYFDTSAAGIWTTLLSGGQLILPTDDQAKDPMELCRLITECEINHFFSVPALYSSLLSCGLRPTDDLLAVTVCGEQSSAEVLDMHDKLMPEVRFFNEYGPTECTVWATVFPATDVKYQPQAGSPVPIGRPIANTRIYILDKYLEPAPVGVTGEIYISGSGVARGYLNQPDLTAEKFLPDPFCTESGQRMYKTGDLGRYLSDGSIEFVGRIDHQAKIRGFRVELEEIEYALRKLPNVKDAIVTTRECSIRGTQIVGHLVVRNNRSPSVRKIQSHLGRLLPTYMVPSAFTFLTAFPMTSNGKIDRNELSRITPAADSSLQFTAPRNKLESALATIWGESINVDRIGIHDNFFAIGGHSLLAAQVVFKIRKTLGYKISLHDFFSRPSIAQLAPLLSATKR